VTQAEAPAPSSSPWYVSSAPPRQKLPAIVVETIVSLVALGIVAGLTALTREPWLIPPLAASMALVIGGAHLPLSQPRNVIGGHIMSAIVGVLVGTIGIDALWSGALAGALALGVMKLTRMPHSPAAATAMIAVVPAIPQGSVWRGRPRGGRAGIVVLLRRRIARRGGLDLRTRRGDPGHRPRVAAPRRRDPTVVP
jgi:HPP family protein